MWRYIKYLCENNIWFARCCLCSIVLPLVQVGSAHKNRKEVKEGRNIHIASLRHRLYINYYHSTDVSGVFSVSLLSITISIQDNSHSTIVSRSPVLFRYLFNLCNKNREREKAHTKSNRIKNRRKCLAIIISFIMEHHIENDKWISINYVARCHLSQIDSYPV